MTSSLPLIFCRRSDTAISKTENSTGDGIPPSIFAEGDYRLVRLTHSNRLVTYRLRELVPYVRGPGLLFVTLDVADVEL